MRLSGIASHVALIAALQFASCLAYAGASAAQQPISLQPKPIETDHVRLSTPVVQAWRQIPVGSPVYALDDAAGATDWLERALFQHIELQTGRWHIWIEPGYSVFRIYPYLSQGSPQPSVYQGIVLKVNGTLSVEDLLAAIRKRTSTITIDEYEVFGAEGVGVERYSRQKVVLDTREPGVYDLAELFKRADRVVLAKVIAGDTESYDVAIYKAEVIKNFKGEAAGKTIYFGPFLGERLGGEYMLFLRDVPKLIAPKQTSSAGYGAIHYSEVFNEGYTSMETSYECVFDGRDTTQQCDHGVKVCTDYIKLPKSIPAFPPERINTPFGYRWVRKDAFVSLLNALASPMQATGK